MKNKQKSEITQDDIKDFRLFLLDSNSCIEQLINSLGSEGKQLDFSPESLKYVDTLLKDRITKKESVYRWEELQKPGIQPTGDEMWLLVRVAYYFAEVLIKNLGAKWTIEKRIRHLHFKKAVLHIDGLLNGIEPLGLVLGNARSNNSKGLFSAYVFAANENQN